jgi:chromosome segregation ATPase
MRITQNPKSEDNEVTVLREEIEQEKMQAATRYRALAEELASLKDTFARADDERAHAHHQLEQQNAELRRIDEWLHRLQSEVAGLASRLTSFPSSTDWVSRHSHEGQTELRRIEENLERLARSLRGPLTALEKEAGYERPRFNRQPSVNALPHSN